MNEKKAFLLGHPVRQSLSPLIHNYWIAVHGIDARYEVMDVAPDQLRDIVRGLADRGECVGFNVTLPHKIAMMDLCDDVDERAAAIGAVNAVTIQNGRLCGTNNDAFGFIENLHHQYPAWREHEGPALVLGAGGAARAVIYALRAAGIADIVVCNRTAARAQELSGLGARVADWDDRQRVAESAGLIVNTTSLGMTGQDLLQIDLSGSAACVYDIVYKPLITDLLQQAQDKKLPVVTGLGMLLQQARPAFQAWFGVLPEIDEELDKKARSAAGTE